jgi:hypothetical protein
MRKSEILKEVYSLIPCRARIETSDNIDDDGHVHKHYYIWSYPEVPVMGFGRTLEAAYDSWMLNYRKSNVTT